MRVRVSVILILTMVLCAVLPGTPAIRSRAVVRLVCLSPPDGLELPGGQAIEIRCRLEAHSPAMIEFLVDSALADSQAVSPNASAALTWLPERPGERVLTLVVRMDGRAVTRMMRRVRVVPAGSPVRVP